MYSGNNFSAEYTIDAHGRSVLRGLTFEETQELEYLDSIPPFEGRLVWPPNHQPLSATEARWLELYEKHRSSCGRLDRL